MRSALIVMLRYAVAGVVAFASAAAVIFASIALGRDEDDASLGFIKTVGFIAVASGAFCFPAGSRWFRSIVLFGLELLAYCLTKLDPNDAYLELHPFPYLVPIVVGGLLAVFFHLVIDTLYLTWPRPGMTPKPAL
jgi:hypothetical protein